MERMAPPAADVPVSQDRKGGRTSETGIAIDHCISAGFREGGEIWGGGVSSAGTVAECPATDGVPAASCGRPQVTEQVEGAKGPRKLLRFYLTDALGKEVLAATGEDQGDAHYSYRNAPTFLAFGTLSCHNRKELVGWLEQVMQESHLRAAGLSTPASVVPGTVDPDAPKYVSHRHVSAWPRLPPPLPSLAPALPTQWGDNGKTVKLYSSMPSVHLGVLVRMRRSGSLLLGPGNLVSRGRVHRSA